jgi:TPR repeat protein
VLPDSQASSYTGAVVDPAGRPAAAATVVLANPSIGYARGAVTDAAGKFAFSLVPPAQGYVLAARRDRVKLVEQAGISMRSADGSDFAGPLRLPVTPDFIAAMQKAAAEDDITAQYLVASWLISGKNLPQDAARGWQWMRSAAERGSAAAQRDLGIAYLHGDGMARDPVSAYVWLAIAGELQPADKAEFDQLSSRLTRAQLLEAKRRVQRWKAAHGDTSASASPTGGQ